MTTRSRPWASFLNLMSLDGDLPWMPVVQGRGSNPSRQVLSRRPGHCCSPATSGTTSSASPPKARPRSPARPANDAAPRNEKGAVLRRERLYHSHVLYHSDVLYHSHVKEWRAARDAGALESLVDRRT